MSDQAMKYAAPSVGHRPLPSIACDLTDVREKRDRYNSITGELTVAEEFASCALDAEYDTLQREFADAFYEMTGLRWSVAEKVMS